jgi:hypothetical protein
MRKQASESQEVTGGWETLNPDLRSRQRQGGRQPGAWADRPLPGDLALPSGYHRPSAKVKTGPPTQAAAAANWRQRGCGR